MYSTDDLSDALPFARTEQIGNATNSLNKHPVEALVNRQAADRNRRRASSTTAFCARAAPSQIGGTTSRRVPVELTERRSPDGRHKQSNRQLMVAGDRVANFQQLVRKTRNRDEMPIEQLARGDRPEVTLALVIRVNPDGCRWPVMVATHAVAAPSFI